VRLLWRRTQRHPDSELVSCYADGYVSPQESAWVSEHIGWCEDCANILHEVRATATLLRRLPTIPVPRAFTLREEPIPVVQAFPFGRWAVQGTAFATSLALLLLLLLDVTGVASDNTQIPSGRPVGVEETQPRILSGSTTDPQRLLPVAEAPGSQQGNAEANVVGNQPTSVQPSVATSNVVASIGPSRASLANTNGQANFSLAERETFFRWWRWELGLAAVASLALMLTMGFRRSRSMR
jgi:hypothetical protein